MNRKTHLKMSICPIYTIALTGTVATSTPAALRGLKDEHYVFVANENDLSFPTCLCGTLIPTLDLGTTCHKTIVEERDTHNIIKLLCRIPTKGTSPEKPDLIPYTDRPA